MYRSVVCLWGYSRPLSSAINRSPLGASRLYSRKSAVKRKLSKPTHYEVLGINSGASAKQIKDRYYQLSKKYHPDVNADPSTSHDIFTQINEAYSVLSDSSRRSEYDNTLPLNRPESTTTFTSAAQRSAASATESSASSSRLHWTGRYSQARMDREKQNQTDLKNERKQESNSTYSKLILWFCVCAGLAKWLSVSVK